MKPSALRYRRLHYRTARTLVTGSPLSTSMHRLLMCDFEAAVEYTRLAKQAVDAAACSGV